MAQLRNISDDTLDLQCSGVAYGVDIAPDAVVTVPDDVYAAHAFPETVWQVVAAPAVAVAVPEDAQPTQPTTASEE